MEHANTSQVSWSFNEGGWTEDFGWFLVDEGEICYAFRSREEGKRFQHEFAVAWMMLLADTAGLYDMMMEPETYRCWRMKQPVRVTSSR